MTRINENFLKLKAGYLFPEIKRRVSAFTQKNPGASLIRLGIGDVTEPLPSSAVEALREAALEMGNREKFRGYGPEQGYDFLREAILENDYLSRGVKLDASEIFISDGSKCDTGNIQEVFSSEAVVAVTDPVYPVYVDTNVMAGRTGEVDETGRYRRILYLPSTAENGFNPPLPEAQADLIYLCSPNNPTGTVLDREGLERWVRYARESGSVILFDAAYEAFITDPDLPHSIYEIEGACECAIEFRSFSKNAGFTGLRCAWTVVPRALRGRTASGQTVSVLDLWNRRHCTKFNGVAYPVQRAAAAIYSETGRKEVQDRVNHYLGNASLIRSTLEELGFSVYGGINAPYVWLKTPGGLSSWDFFDLLLEKSHLVGTPGAGFGPSGEGYFRLSAFGSREDVLAAMERIRRQGAF